MTPDVEQSLKEIELEGIELWIYARDTPS